MVAQLGNRLAGLLVVMAFVVTLTFIIVRIVPGDPAAAMLGNDATADQIAALRSQLGLDRSLTAQFFTFLADLAHGDLGESIFLNRPVCLHDGSA